MPRAGTMYELRLYTHTRHNIAAMLSDMVEAPSDPVEHTSFLQVDLTKVQFSDPFQEICCSLWEQFQQVLQQENNPVDTDEDGCETFSGSSQWKRTQKDSVSHDEITELQQILQELQTPWQGLSSDHTHVPNMHPVAIHAIEVTKPTNHSGRCLHIFTDGSASKQTSAWSFVVLAQVEHCGHTFYRRFGFSAALVDDDLGECQRNAQDAEATAIIAACEYLLSLSDKDGKEAHLHFDARNVGFGAVGIQNEVQSFGDVSPRQHLARVLLSLVQRTYGSTQGFHVHAHQLNPWNEYADSLAVACRKGWKPPNQVALRSGRLAKHSLRDCMDWNCTFTRDPRFAPHSCQWSTHNHVWMARQVFPAMHQKF